MREYLLRHKYTLHPCETISAEQKRQKMCGPFVKFVTSPLERHEYMHNNAFTGAASLVDIVHHTQAGFAGRVRSNPGNGGLYR